MEKLFSQILFADYPFNCEVGLYIGSYIFFGIIGLIIYALYRLIRHLAKRKILEAWSHDLETIVFVYKWIPRTIIWGTWILSSVMATAWIRVGLYC